MRVFTFIFLFSLTTAVAFANPINEINREKSICFAKNFSGAEMSAKPLQTVSSFNLQIYQQPDKADPTIYMNMQITKDAAVYDSFMICERNGENLSCAVECDGGQAEVISLGGEARKLQFVNKGFLVNGGCGDGNEVWLEPTQGGDDIFELEQLPARQCL